MGHWPTMLVRISSVAIVLCLSEIVSPIVQRVINPYKPYDLWDMRKYLFQSCRNNIESIKDTDTYMRDTALLLIEPVTLI